MRFQLTDHSEQNGLPHLVDVVVLLDFENDDASFWRVFPHRHQVVAEEVDVDFSRHLGGLLHVHVVIEEVLDGGHLAKRAELLAKALSLRRVLVWLGLRPDASDALNRLSLMLRVERCLALIVPELPGCLAAVASLRHELSRSGLVRDRRLIEVRYLNR